MKQLISGLFTLFAVSCSTAYLALDSAEEFDLEKYMGKWYEIYRLPNKFEEGLEDITAHYELTDDGRVIVTNEGRVIEDRSRIKQAKGKAWVPDPKEPSKLKVSFFWPFSGDYWILKIDPEYTHALVGDPGGKFLWILSRERKPDPEIVEQLKAYASTLGFDVEKMISGQVY
ncbi:MAG: lipocalin family protein [Bacteroidales bacterium]|jgi:apolipoprotein D and lipocalin family protein|nr:lipocalin family protein [Bacteroidales bacterium]